MPGARALSYVANLCTRFFSLEVGLAMAGCSGTACCCEADALATAPSLAAAAGELDEHRAAPDVPPLEGTERATQ